METRRQLSRPLYESLPYLYIAAGLCGFLGGYLLAGKIWSDLLLIAGAVGVLGGLVLILRRRDYRSRRYTGAPLDDR